MLVNRGLVGTVDQDLLGADTTTRLFDFAVSNHAVYVVVPNVVPDSL